MKNLKKGLLLLVLLSLPLWAFSQESFSDGAAENQETIAPILIQLHQISIQQAKQSATPEISLEAEYNLIVTELEESYQKMLTELEMSYQQKLTQQEADSLKCVEKVQAAADQELALIRQKVEIYEQQQKKEWWENLGTFGSGFSLGIGIAGTVGFIYLLSQGLSQ